MTRAHKTVSVNIPFPGFYESSLSYDLDLAEEMMCDHDSNEMESEREHPEHLQLDSDELRDCLFGAMDYRKAHFYLARDYAEAFDIAAGDLLGLHKSGISTTWNENKDFYARQHRQPSLHIEFEEMTSPREYNFTTDRLFVKIPLAVMWRMFKRSAANGHETLAKVIKDRFTSYDGFWSHYSNNLDSWLDKPLADWDHNEMGTLIIAALHDASPDHDERMFYDIAEGMNESAYNAIDHACDWNRYEELKADKRAEKEAAFADA